MNKKTPVILYSLSALLFAYAVLATIQVRKLEARVSIMENQITHIFDAKIQKVASTHQAPPLTSR